MSPEILVHLCCYHPEIERECDRLARLDPEVISGVVISPRPTATSLDLFRLLGAVNRYGFSKVILEMNLYPPSIQPELVAEMVDRYLDIAWCGATHMAVHPEMLVVIQRDHLRRIDYSVKIMMDGVDTSDKVMRCGLDSIICDASDLQGSWCSKPLTPPIFVRSPWPVNVSSMRPESLRRLGARGLVYTYNDLTEEGRLNPRERILEIRTILDTYRGLDVNARLASSRIAANFA